MFTSEEIGNLIRGDLDVVWTRDELLAYISPGMEYTKSSATFLYLVDVLMAFSAEERRKFVGFVSGSSCLPVGGWRNLQPRLKVIPKEANEGPYPSVSVFAHAHGIFVSSVFPVLQILHSSITSRKTSTLIKNASHLAFNYILVNVVLHVLIFVISSYLSSNHNY